MAARTTLIDAATNLWTPAIIDGVRSGSWFHHTECFGPVLGLMAAHDLDDAIALQNAVAYGLTGGIHTLDPATSSDGWIGSRSATRTSTAAPRAPSSAGSRSGDGSGR